ncbi:flavin reductase (NADPH)-like [Gymnodraco acuticeps]|uniref:Flavin reductase (NADPH)-like n=2 Tax=Notothenioidei TaxID=8205 RepID=A0A6P8W0H3_GYMAC|nr:flavin reductase (NADPH)-like [Pseudochaenichthys georgianus]XP_034081182.1 flavin reductase (NADPH)-like [Gymnodraco acuticeps]
MAESVRMKIAVLGATGQTGQYLVNQALQQGHTVTAIVRNPAKLTVHHDNLKVVEADIFSADSLKTHFKGQDVVMSCLGFPASFFSGVSGYTLSMTSMISAMREARVNKIITMTSWYTEPNSGAQSSFLIRFLLLPMIRSVLTNMHEMEKLLHKTEDISWTVVRPPGLKNLQASAQEFLTHEGYFVPDGSGLPVGSAVGRGDVARFMLSLLNSNAWVNKGVAITTK